MMDVLILDETHILYEGKAQRIHFRGKEGEFEVAQNHMPVLSLLKKGTIHIVNRGSGIGDRESGIGDRGGRDPRSTHHDTRIRIERGIMKMEQNRVLVMVEGS